MLRALLQAVDAVVEGFRADPDRLRLPRRLVAETPALAAPSSRAGLDWEAASRRPFAAGSGIVPRPGCAPT